MRELAEKWRRMPLPYRYVTVAGMSAVLASVYTGVSMAAEHSPQRDNAAEVASAVMHFSVAVDCDKRDADVLVARKDITTLFSCLNADGSLGEVDWIARVDPSIQAGAHSHNQVTDIAAPAGSDLNTITFDFVGPEGKATMEHVLYDGSVINENGSARNTNLIDGITQVTISK